MGKLILDRLSPDAVISEKLKVGVADHLRLKEEAASNADAESSLSGMQRHSSAPEYTNVNLPASFSRPLCSKCCFEERSFSTPDGAVNINAGVHADENAPRRSSLKYDRASNTMSGVAVHDLFATGGAFHSPKLQTELMEVLSGLSRWTFNVFELEKLCDRPLCIVVWALLDSYSALSVVEPKQLRALLSRSRAAIAPPINIATIFTAQTLHIR